MARASTAKLRMQEDQLMGTGSALPEDPTTLLGIELTPSERFQRLADTLHAQQDGGEPVGDPRPPVQADAVEAGEDDTRGSGWQNRIGLFLAIFVVTIGPCGALLTALGPPHFGPNSHSDTANVVAASTAPRPALADQPAPGPDTAQAAASTAPRPAIADQPAPGPETVQASPAAASIEARDSTAKSTDPAPGHAVSKTYLAALSHGAARQYLNKTRSSRHNMTAPIARVRAIADVQHGGPYARTGNGPGNFFSGDR
jgi:hypothetical protein